MRDPRFCDLDDGYCYAGTSCAPDPTLTIETSEGGGCVDLGIDPTTVPALRFTITGRPNATSTQHDRQASCAGAPRQPADVRALDATGRATDTLASGALSGCGSSVYGRSVVDVEVGGQVSNTQEVIDSNSTCPSVSTCTLARGFCP